MFLDERENYERIKRNTQREYEHENVCAPDVSFSCCPCKLKSCDVIIVTRVDYFLLNEQMGV